MKQETIDRIRKFTEDRDWDQFHSPGKILQNQFVIEAAELLECFQWNDEEYDFTACKRGNSGCHGLLPESVGQVGAGYR